MAPSRYYRNYLRTYVERDVRAMVNIIMDAVKWYKNRDDDAQFHFLRTQTQADKRVGLVDTQALIHLACLWHAVNHEEDEEIDDGEILRRIDALYREASLSQALGRWIWR